MTTINTILMGKAKESELTIINMVDPVSRKNVEVMVKAVMEPVYQLLNTFSPMNLVSALSGNGKEKVISNTLIAMLSLMKGNLRKIELTPEDTDYDPGIIFSNVCVAADAGNDVLKDMLPNILSPAMTIIQNTIYRGETMITVIEQADTMGEAYKGLLAENELWIDEVIETCEGMEDRDWLTAVHAVIEAVKLLK